MLTQTLWPHQKSEPYLHTEGHSWVDSLDSTWAQRGKPPPRSCIRELAHRGSKRYPNQGHDYSAHPTQQLRPAGHV